MVLKFTKMHALGNDFVVIDGVRQNFSLSAQDIRLIADRHFGVGCDQILIAETFSGEDADFRFRIMNADGSEVAQCGNGARCFAKFVLDQGLTDKRRITVATGNGLLELAVLEDGKVKVNMGVPNFEPEYVPFEAMVKERSYALVIDERTLDVAVLSIGNPHAVHVVPHIEDAPVADIGPQLERHPRFPERVNAGFMEVVDESHIKLRVFERGAGETLACGSGACAAVAAGRQWGLLAAHVTVELPGGRLRVEWHGEGSPVYLIGPATTVFKGTIPFVND